MPASPDPCNMFEVIMPPLLGEKDQLFAFTFHPSSPGPVVSPSVLCNSTMINLYISDGENYHGPASSIPYPLSYSSSKAIDPPTCLGWRLTNSCSTHAV